MEPDGRGSLQRASVRLGASVGCVIIVVLVASTAMGRGNDQDDLDPGTPIAVGTVAAAGLLPKDNAQRVALSDGHASVAELRAGLDRTAQCAHDAAKVLGLGLEVHRDDGGAFPVSSYEVDFTAPGASVENGDRFESELTRCELLNSSLLLMTLQGGSPTDERGQNVVAEDIRRVVP